jgi:hypothetical protein
MHWLPQTKWPLKGNIIHFNSLIIFSPIHKLGFLQFLRFM